MADLTTAFAALNPEQFYCIQSDGSKSEDAEGNWGLAGNCGINNAAIWLQSYVSIKPWLLRLIALFTKWQSFPLFFNLFMTSTCLLVPRFLFQFNSSKSLPGWPLTDQIFEDWRTVVYQGIGCSAGGSHHHSGVQYSTRSLFWECQDQKRRSICSSGSRSWLLRGKCCAFRMIESVIDVTDGCSSTTIRRNFVEFCLVMSQKMVNDVGGWSIPSRNRWETNNF